MAESGSGSPGNIRSESPVNRHSGSPPDTPPSKQNGSPVGSPTSDGSGSPRSRHSGSPGRNRSDIPGSRHIDSGAGTHRSDGSASPADSGAGSATAKVARSPAGSPTHSRDGSHHSVSPRRSRSGSPARSQGTCPENGAGSETSRKSRSLSRSKSLSRSRSGSPGSGNGSPVSKPSRSKSGSSSPRKINSRSVSPVQRQTRSGSGSPVPSETHSRISLNGSDSPSAVNLIDSDAEKVSKRSIDASDSDDEIGKSKKRRIASSDEEGDQDADGEKPTEHDLFGDAGDISSDSEKGEKERDENEDQEPRRMGDDEEEQEEGPPPETRIDVEIPRICTNLGKDIHYVKLPNFLSVETRPFDPMYYEDEIDDDDVLDEEGRTRMKLKVENTIRWRTKQDNGQDVLDKDGNPVKQSNARIVRWSDGSMSLNLGKEIFDVHTMTIQGDYNHLFVRQGTGLQGQAVFKTKLTFRPHSTDSFTHRKITLSMADRATKTQKIRVIPITGKDPDSKRDEMIKKEEERLRASVRRDSQKRRVREKALSRGPSSSYLEDTYDDEEDGEEAVSLAAIKKQYKQGRKDPRPNIYSSDSDSDAMDDGDRKKRLMKAKKLSSDEEEGSGADDD